MLGPPLIDRNLARRLEGTSQSERAAYIEQHRILFPSRKVATLHIGGAFAAVCGSHVADEISGHRAFSRCIGLGFDEPATQAMMDELEAFYAGHGLPTRIDACPFADPGLFEILRERGYVIESVLNTWFRRAQPVAFEPAPDVSVSLTGAEERAEWRDTIGRGFANDDEIPLDPIAETISRLPGKLLFLARIGGGAVGAAAANVRDGIGLVNGAATRAGYRRRGVQQALLAARINHLAGECEHLVVTATPGTASERNIQRFGFQLLHTKPILIGNRGRPVAR